VSDEREKGPRAEEPAPLSPGAPAGAAAAGDTVVEKVDTGATNAAAAVDSGAQSTADTIGAKLSEAADAISAKASEAAGAVSARTAGAADAVTFKAAGPASSAQATTDDRPELLVGGAFAGGFLLALILKRLGN